MAYIYKITNDINNKIYIGETTRTIKARWTQHLYRAKTNHSEHLYCAMRKYGIEHFHIEEVEYCQASERFERETHYIKQFNSLEPHGYNWLLYQCGPSNEMIDVILEEWENGLNVIAISNKLHLGVKTVSLILKGNGISENEILKRRAEYIGKLSSKQIIQYSLSGDIIEIFNSASEAGRALGLNNSSISKCAKGDLLTYNNYIWQYAENDNIEEIIALLESKPKVGKNKKSIRQLTLDGIYIKTFESASAAGRSLNKAHAGIAYAARNGSTAYGFKWEYET